MLDGRFPPSALAGADDVTLWWLGQAGFAIRHADTLVMIDPYLSDSLAEKYHGTLFPHVRAFPPPVDPAAVEGLALVACTHAHTDHMDPGSISALQRSSTPVFVVPRAERSRAVQRGVPVERLLGTNAGESLAPVAGVRIKAVPAAHEDLVRDDAGNYHHLGYLVELGGVRLYHSGDCIPYEGQADLLRGEGIDLALLPVNGRDAYRSGHGVPGNFHWHEALRLCEAAGIPALVCHHWGLFDFNTIDPRALRTALEASGTSVLWRIPEVGRPYLVGPGGASRDG